MKPRGIRAAQRASLCVARTIWKMRSRTKNSFHASRVEMHFQQKMLRHWPPWSAAPPGIRRTIRMTGQIEKRKHDIEPQINADARRSERIVVACLICVHLRLSAAKTVFLFVPAMHPQLTPVDACLPGAQLRSHAHSRAQPRSTVHNTGQLNEQSQTERWPCPRMVDAPVAG